MVPVHGVAISDFRQYMLCVISIQLTLYLKRRKREILRKFGTTSRHGGRSPFTHSGKKIRNCNGCGYAVSVESHEAPFSFRRREIFFSSYL
ncbi:hypothetical protein TNIN_19791 [Trichonephila inaurata madagascariensis]|uniref:Uncharacterized protein n=1 Tax=Trichonephila inaurata madagascariensis TaxID=2747483 RepID=A0A8X6XKS7_9ARAC|nr:hypothetical protein TNIN_19791 [Trichonephila inaurata madagascariensis]